MKEPCPYCGSPYGQTSEFMYGCTNSLCPEFPRIHDPVGQDEVKAEFWKNVQLDSTMRKMMKRAELKRLQENVDKYYK